MLKSNKIHITKETSKFITNVIKAIIFTSFELDPMKIVRVEIINIPIKGINNNNNGNILCFEKNI